MGPYNVPTWRKVGLIHSEYNVQRTSQRGPRVQTGEWVGILQRFVWYTGAGLLVSSIAALAVRLWLPESSHMPLFIVVHSLCIGVALMLLIRSVDTAKTGSTLHKVYRTNHSRVRRTRHRDNNVLVESETQNVS